ncbi:hypothetical protein ACVFI8_13930 [Agarivorans sp. MS3-6]
MMIRLSLLVIFSGLFSGFSQAEQLRFERNAGHYAYLWNDQQHQQQQLQFELLNYPHKLTKFIQYRPKHAQQYVLAQLKASVNNIDPKRAQVNFSSDNGQLNYQLKGNDQALLKQLAASLNEEINQHYQDYLTQQYFVEKKTADGQVGIMPDHNRFAHESAQYLFSWLSNSLHALGDKQSDTREVTNYLLGFVQSIPYNPLRSRDNLRGAGYLTPIQVIRNNLGDCDSKTTLIASALKTVFPRLDVVIIYVPNHALLAISVAPRADDETVEINGRKYVLAEPTGPALYKLGEVAKTSAQYIRAGFYTYQRMNWTAPEFKTEK